MIHRLYEFVALIVVSIQAWWVDPPGSSSKLQAYEEDGR